MHRGRSVDIETTDVTPYTEIYSELEGVLESFDGQSDEKKDFRRYNRAIELLAKLPDGRRNGTAEKLATAMRDYGISKTSVVNAVEREKKGLANPKRRSVDDYATELYERVQPAVTLYRDIASDDTYAGVEVQSNGTTHYVFHAISSKQFRTFLHNAGYAEFGRVVRPEVLKTVSMKFEGDSAQDVSLSQRVAYRDDTVYYDLCDSEHQAVRITAHGWELVTIDLPLFKSGTRQAAQVIPDKNAECKDIESLADMLSIPTTQEALLTLVWIHASLIPDLAAPILNFYGAKDTGKTLRTKTIVQVCDPSVADSLRHFRDVVVFKQPKDEETVRNQICNRHVVAYDNISCTADWLASILSGTVFGTYDQKRKQYTDGEPFLMQLKGPIIINGTHRLGLHYTDFQDRIMPIRCEPISNRMPESRYWEHYVAEAPTILGSIFSILSEALTRLSQIKIKNPSRFGDFERWGSAIAIAMGYSQRKFLHAFRENRQLVSIQVVESSPLAQSIEHLLEANPVWEGTPNELLRELARSAQTLQINVQEAKFLASDAHLTRKLNEIKDNIADIGIIYAHSSKTFNTDRTASGRSTRNIISLSRSSPKAPL